MHRMLIVLDFPKLKDVELSRRLQTDQYHLRFRQGPKILYPTSALSLCDLRATSTTLRLRGE